MLVESSQEKLSSDDLSIIYGCVRHAASKLPFRHKGATRNADDFDEACHDVFARFSTRANALWDRQRPLAAYVNASVTVELLKYRKRAFRDEIRQTTEVQK